MSAILVDSQTNVAKQASEKTAERPFLTAQWRQLAMINYEIDPAVLAPHVPAGTELDFFAGRTYVSLVGFLFRDTRVRGWAVPFHRNFEEVNLRFYVRRRAPEGWRRGVVFVRELVRLPAISVVARWFYQENYLTVPMRHHIHATDERIEAHYTWRHARSEYSLGVTTRGPWRSFPRSARVSDPAEMLETFGRPNGGVGKPAPNGGGVGKPAPNVLQPETLEEFIAEHYWGYSGQRDGSTKEYRVDHPSWRVREASSAHFIGDVTKLYGPQFAEFLIERPQSAFLAEGSEVELFRGVKLLRE